MTSQPSLPSDQSFSPAQPGRFRVIAPPGRWPSLELGDLWRYRELLFQLVKRDFSGMYRQTFVGAGWAIISPVITMIVFTVVFGNMAKVPSDGIPYPLFCFSGLLPWNYFLSCLTRSSTSTIGGNALITKVYIPRLILPLSKVVHGLIAFGIQFVILAGLMVWYQVPLRLPLLAIPVFVAICALTGLAIGLWLTAICVKYRDVAQLVPFLGQMWLWASPVAYPASLASSKWQALYWINPMVGTIEGFRWAVLGNTHPNWNMMAVSLCGVACLLVSGHYFFRKVENTFADFI